MRRTVRPLRGLDTRLRVPGDKSIAHRALVLAGVAEGPSCLRGMPEGEDVAATRRAMEALGVEVDATPERIRVRGRGFQGLRPPGAPLDAANSGTTMRLLAGLLAGRPFDAEITGDAWLTRRPMERVAHPLRLMGARLELLGANGRPPVRIHGTRLQGLEYRMPVASAQVKSAVLLAALQAAGPTVITEPLPSRDHTERMLKAMGAAVATEGNAVRLEPGSLLKPLELTLPGDVSSAAPWLFAAALRPGWRMVVEGVGVNPGRTRFLDLLERAGAAVSRTDVSETVGEPRATITVEGRQLRAVEVAAAEVPGLIDELPLLAVLGACARGVSRVRGAGELRVKESDRIAGIGAILRAMGAAFEEFPDGFALEGTAGLHGARVDAAGDHRLAIAAAIAGLVADGETEVEGAEAVAVSYPGFWEDLENLAL